MVNSVTFMTSSNTAGPDARPPKPPSAVKRNELSDSSSSSDDEDLKKELRARDDDNSSDWSAKDSIDLEIKEMRRKEK